ncbi:MAG TPA: hypothetical protein ENG33_09500 [Chloroflexi bacterium]|nr:hypothetical protein [Chloroflexota bacterium]
MKIIDLSREKGEIEIVLNTMQMARALGKSEATVRRMDLVREGRGRWRLFASLERVRKTGTKEEKERWETELKAAKAQLEQIKLERERGELIPRAEIAKLWAMRAAEVKAGLMQLVRKLPPRLEGLEKEEMAEIIREEVYAVLKRYTRKGPYTPSKRKNGS